MKNISSLFLLPGIALALSACDAKAQPNYTLSLPAPAGVTNTMAYLVDWDTGEKVDSAIVASDTIHFSGTIADPFIGRVMLGGQRGPIMIVEKGVIILDEQGIPSGTALNDKYAAGIRQMLAYEEEYGKLNQNDSIQHAKADSIAQRAQALPGNLFAENQDNVLGLFWYMQKAYDLPLKDLEVARAALPILANSKRLQALIEAEQRKAALGVGKHYADFTVDYDGKAQKFSDYVKPGEYTLVDFWASWCGPCMRQAKVIKELYNKYKDKGLNVVGVAVWDEPENTLAAIKSHGLEWPNIINAQTIPTDLYGISGIPCIILINPEGIIVSRDKQGQDLIDDVDKAMADYQPVAQEAESAPAAPADTAVIF
ncbi:MAG: AhpC/TSA family protein [Muribaculaceae bacterium]|nr:AhpC/TSA family protein [Muribaculaceae bacterium]